MAIKIAVLSVWDIDRHLCADRASWNNSTAPLNNKNVLTNIYHKTTWEHIEVLKTEKMARLARRDDWPEYSTYTAGYLLKENIPEGMTSDTVWVIQQAF